MSSEKVQSMTESSLTIPSDSEQYSANDELSPSPPPSSSSPMILYTPPTFWGLVRGAAINLFLPFVNGLMLGFGELFAHEAAFRLGWGGTKVFPSGRSAHSIGPGIEVRENPIDIRVELAGGPMLNHLPCYPAKVSAGRFSSTTLRNAPIPIPIPIGVRALLSQARFTICRQPTRTQLSMESLLIRNGATMRFASTTPLPAVSSTPIPPESAAAAATTPLSTPTSELFTSIEEALSNNPLPPNEIGYFASLGIEYPGWRPTGLMLNLFEHLHVYTGLPWWAVIALTAAAIRVAFFGPAISAADNSARLQKITPIMGPLMEETKAALKIKDIDAALKNQRKLDQIKKEAGFKQSKMFLPMLQIFPTSGSFFALRALSDGRVPAFEIEGLLWFQNLTLADPYFVLPLATSFLLYSNVKRGGELGTSAALSPEIQKAMLYGFPAISLAFTSWLPAAIQLSFCVSGLGGWIQAYLITKPQFRTWWGMLPIQKKAPLVVDQSGAPMENTSPIAMFRQHSANIREAATGVKAKLSELTLESEDEKARRIAAAYEARRQKQIEEERILAEAEEQRRRRRRKRKASKTQ
ncbi:hypothetical protein HYFRA_00003743 [Hymenoscyphus fraxineus]|uniref:Membrane insertase YidC/Oxa/ALB C-terminal domain-containing protein n=1 Tax=Hymenoscyphus fraxineus TaxID=746836 RepID=A0A9N9PR06_9HELO|nr:hypothetical protein HYFRA_00003743 [Hymenoscyphus fraxineus]